MEASEKVSIVLPTYNGAKFLQQSIDSCLNQTYKNIELIIVDDGSMDKTSNIIRSYHDNRIIYVKHKKNRGLADALNSGFAVAKGEYLTWTSDDNRYDHDAVEAMVGALRTNKKVDFVYANYHVININDEVLHSINSASSEKLREYNCIGPCFLYRRKVYEVIGAYNRDAFLAEDYEYWIRVFKRFRMIKLDRFIYRHRLHPQSLTGQYAEEAKRSADHIRDHFFKIHAMKRGLLSSLSHGKKAIRKVLSAFFGFNRKFINKIG
jgi:glycosyltransferase involved in cell wall biosynthesis